MLNIITKDFLNHDNHDHTDYFSVCTIKISTIFYKESPIWASIFCIIKLGGMIHPLIVVNI